MDSELLIYPDRLGEAPEVFEGDATLGELPRLAQSIADHPIELHFRVAARLDIQRRKVVSCIIEGFVFLTCQSTLEDFRHAISIDERIVLVDGEEELPPIEAESDAEDYLVADGPVDVRSLVEDAILLSLPMVPRKPGLGQGEKPKDEGVAGLKESPFAALASLKKRK
ncbi:MAG TPA: YceD family protein [Usitatibacter sp.]|jgi:uncharacterized protein|nr:YceD family protein [Usitatibacter sp.]